MVDKIDKILAKITASPTKNWKIMNNNNSRSHAPAWERIHKTDRAFQFWQEGVHQEWIQDEAMMKQKAEYIHNNPVKRGYVDRAKHRRCSIVRNYPGEKGLAEICTKL